MENENENEKIDRDAFLQHFPGYCLQSFDDKEDRKDKALITCGSPNEQYWQRLANLNKKGAGVFFTANAFPSGRRRKVDCTGVNAWYFEIDDISIDEQWERIKKAPIHPGIIVQTQKSLHCYYLAKDGAISSFNTIVKGLIQYFESDPACKDISRVLRVPGFCHNKGEPVEVHIVHYGPKLHTEAEMLEKFPYVEPEKQTNENMETVQEVTGLSFWEAASGLNNKIVLERLSGGVMVNHEVFSFRPRSGGGEYIDVNGKPADAWIDSQGMIGSSKGGGPTFIQWLEYYGCDKAAIAKWTKENCKDLLPAEVVEGDKQRDDDKKTQAEIILELFKSQGPVIFRDDMDEGYVQVDVDGKLVLMKCESRKFEKYLARLCWKELDRVMGRDGIARAAQIVTAEAEYGKIYYKLFNRVAKYEDSFRYDLGDSKSICCSRGRWSVIENGPVLFKLYQHQKVQLVPGCKEGDVKRYLKYVRVKREDQQLLLLVWLIAAFVPEIAHPILVLFGEKGASKSTTMRFIRSLIDPSKAPLLSLPPVNECIQQLDHNYFAPYDNVTTISARVSDILCRAVTGAGSSKRVLYSDDDDKIYNYRRVIALNGINNVVQSADLLDRSILVELERIPRKERKTELEIDADFAVDKPIILAGIFDVLCKAMTLFDTIEIDEFPRMADFAKWGCAIAKALGYEEQQFIDAYNANIGQQNAEVIENDPVAHCIAVLMSRRDDDWTGSPTELFEELNTLAFDLKLDVKEMPGSPTVMGKSINMVLSNLMEVGIKVETSKDTSAKRGRAYTISKINVAHDAEVPTRAEETGSSAVSDVSDASDVNKETQEYLEGKVEAKDISSEAWGNAAESIFLNKESDEV